MKTITYKDFLKLEIKIGTIERAEKIKNSNKLLKLQIGVGKKRPIQVLSGIAKHYLGESLVGRQVLVLVNLEPRVIMGFKSAGMILAADASGDPVLLMPEKQLPNGSSVC